MWCVGAWGLLGSCDVRCDSTMLSKPLCAFNVIQGNSYYRERGRRIWSSVFLVRYRALEAPDILAKFVM